MNVVIIGASSGIGRELSALYVKNGHTVGLVGRRTERLESLCREYNGRGCYRAVDITDLPAARTALASLCAEMGCPDVVIVCAGAGELNPNLDFGLERSAILTNIWGWTHVVDWAWQAFVAQGYGHLVLITSVGGLRGESAAPAYSASKAYQMNYAEALRKRGWKQKLPLRVTDIRPGLTDTAMAKGEGLFWVMPVERVARQIYRAIARKTPVCTVSRRWRMVAWLVRHLPFWLYKRC